MVKKDISTNMQIKLLEQRIPKITEENFKLHITKEGWEEKIDNLYTDVIAYEEAVDEINNASKSLRKHKDQIEREINQLEEALAN